MGVYVFGEPGMLIVKVGYSGPTKQREMALGRYWRGGQMLYDSPWRSSSQLAERLAHRMLRPRYWLDGEWFVCGAAVAKAVVRRANKIIAQRCQAARRDMRRTTPQRVKQILSVMVRERRGPTDEESRQVDAAWLAWDLQRPKQRKRRS